MYRIVGIPNIYWSGNEREFNAIVIDLLGDTLSTLLVNSKHKFSLKTVLMLADQIVKYAQTIAWKNRICSFQKLHSPRHQTNQLLDRIDR